MRIGLALLGLATMATGCNSILGIPDVELTTCTDPIAPEAGYGMVNLNSTGTAFINAEALMRITMRGNLNTATRPDRLQLELFHGTSFGGPGQAPIPGTYDLIGSERDYDSCGICLRIFTQVDVGGTGTSVYMPNSGTLRLTSASGRLTGSLEDVTLRRVIIGANFVTTDHPSNCETTVTRADFDLGIVLIDAATSQDAI